MTFRLALLLLCLCCSTYGQNKPKVSMVRPPLNKIIQGIWWSTEYLPSAAFVVNDSTFFYPDMFTEHKYSVSGDTLFIEYDDGISESLIVKATADTLILRSFGIQQTYLRTEPRRR
jgi:hypothetical protein